MNASWYFPSQAQTFSLSFCRRGGQYLQSSGSFTKTCHSEKELSSALLVGRLASCRFRTFFGSSFMPCLLNTRPTNRTSSTSKTHLSGFTVIPRYLLGLTGPSAGLRHALQLTHRSRCRPLCSLGLEYRKASYASPFR